jgi:hypothetical protein
LAYFSPIVGGPQNGYRHLVDSSLDWGQDLPGLRDWLTINQRTDETTHLAYFGTDDPEHHGIYATHLPSILDLRSSQSLSWPVPGLYAVSATMLQQVYLPVRGLWTLENEAEYQTARALAPYFRQIEQHPTNPSLLKLGNLETWTARWRRFEILRFARLCHYLRSRQPDANVGYSILIYRLTQNELDDALEGPWSRLVTAIERNQHLNP